MFPNLSSGTHFHPPWWAAQRHRGVSYENLSGEDGCGINELT